MSDIFTSNMNPLYSYRARAASVHGIYDGDTLRLDIDLGFSIVHQNISIRLWGINTPEVRGSDEEKSKGLAAREFLRNLLFEKDGLAKELTLYTVKDSKGKYGRYLGILVLDSVIVNQLLVEEGHAQLYLV